jgi:Methylase involved in ubiquinone/menaquinone biosynthesis
MGLGWINVEEFSFNCLLAMETFQLSGMFTWHKNNDEWKRHMGITLANNPVVKWYIVYKCPQHAAFIEEITSGVYECDVRKSELYILASIEDFVVYTRPEIMDSSCDFIYAWSKERLYELTDFKDKLVLDVGSGSGRLAFAAAEQAKFVIASEPVTTLREYLNNKIKRENITNMRVANGMAHDLPFLDNTFDIVMSGHVVGDDYDSELAELERVVKSGGWILDCPGERCDKDDTLVGLGWEELRYESSLGGYAYRYRKQIFK